MTLFPVPSPTFATLFNPDISPSPTQLSPAGALGYPSDWRTTPDNPLEFILAGCCTVVVDSGPCESASAGFLVAIGYLAGISEYSK